MTPALEQFLTAAKQFVDVVGFDHIRLGAVATTAPRLVGAARSLSERQPILFTTQSDALIGLLDNLEQLQEWLKSFSLREMRRDLEDWSAEP